MQITLPSTFLSPYNTQVKELVLQPLDAIFSYLDLNDFYSSMLVCQRWKVHSIKVVNLQFRNCIKVWKAWVETKNIESLHFDSVLDLFHQGLKTKIENFKHLTGFIENFLIQLEDNHVEDLKNFENDIETVDAKLEVSLPNQYRMAKHWKELALLYITWSDENIPIDPQCLKQTKQMILTLCKEKHYAVVFKLLSLIPHFDFQDLTRTYLALALIEQSNDIERAQRVVKGPLELSLLFKLVKLLLRSNCSQALKLTQTITSPVIREICLLDVFKTALKQKKFDIAIETFNALDDQSLEENIANLKTVRLILSSIKNSDTSEQIDFLFNQLFKTKLAFKVHCYKQLLEEIVGQGNLTLAKKVDLKIKIGSENYKTLYAMTRSLYRAFSRTENFDHSLQVLKLLVSHTHTRSSLLSCLITALIDKRTVTRQQAERALNLAFHIPNAFIRSRTFSQLINQYWLQTDWQVAYALALQVGLSYSRNILLEKICAKALLEESPNFDTLHRMIEVMSDAEIQKRTLKLVKKAQKTQKRKNKANHCLIS